MGVGARCHMLWERPLAWDIGQGLLRTDFAIEKYE